MTLTLQLREGRAVIGIAPCGSENTLAASSIGHILSQIRDQQAIGGAEKRHFLSTALCETTYLKTNVGLRSIYRFPVYPSDIIWI